MKFEGTPEARAERKRFRCRYCNEVFESELGGFCPHCHRFQTNSVHKDLPEPLDDGQK